MTREDLKQAIFGSFDGLTSALGVITGLVVAGTHTGSRIFAGAVGLAVAATLAGSILPALPFVLGYGTGELIASATLTLTAALTIGHYRGYRLTLSILIVVAAVTVALTAIVA